GVSIQVDDSSFSSIVVGIRARGQTLGALRVIALPPKRRYTDDDRALLEAVSEQAGAALANARHEWLRDDERRRIALDLHDYVEQTFFAIGLTASAALDSRHRSVELQNVTEALQHIEQLSAAGAEQLRSAIFALKQPEYSRLGLV